MVKPQFGDAFGTDLFPIVSKCPTILQLAIVMNNKKNMATPAIPIVSLW